MKGPSGQTVERLLFGLSIIVGYILVTWYGASGKAEAKEAGQIVHDAMLALGPLVGVIVYSIFKTDRDAPDTSSVEVKQPPGGPSLANAVPVQPSPQPDPAPQKAFDAGAPTPPDPRQPGET